MEKIHLRVVNPNKLVFDGDVDNIILRTTEGDVGIMRNHINYFASLSTGFLRIFINNNEQKAICSGGFVQVSENNINVISQYCDFISNIEKDDIENNISNFENKLKSKDLTEEDKKVCISNIDINKKILDLINL